MINTQVAGFAAIGAVFLGDVGQIKPTKPQLSHTNRFELGGFKFEVQHLLSDKVSRCQALRRHTANSSLKTG